MEPQKLAEQKQSEREQIDGTGEFVLRRHVA